MADATPQKRVLPARERRESAAKRLASSSAVQPSPVAKTAPPETEPRQKRKYTKRASLVKVVERTPDSSTPGPAEDVLPTKVTSTRPLPVLREKQPENLSSNEYQSFADSALLTASLQRSRMQWLCEGIFQRYWTKPMKRKGVVIEPPGNPDVKTMQKLGNATMTIEPHTFDVTFYTVKDPKSASIPYQRHPNQHTPKPHPSYPAAGSHSTPHPSTPQPAAQPSATAAQPSATTNAATPTVKQELTVQNKPPTPSPVPAGIAPPATAVAHTAAPPSQQPPARPTPAKPSDDPVIQMLAARAATDTRLKDLMKVVAMSQATPEQLREFQSHIDEFNAVVKQREAKKAEAEQQKGKPPVTTVAPTVGAASSTTTQNRAYPPASGPTPMHPPPYMAYHAPPYRPEPIIKHVVVEFHSPVSFSQGSTTDRWLLPEHAVLEMKPNGTEMIASFFVERKGEDILKMVEEGDETLQQRYKTDVEYFQPVTMMIKATQHRTIETIARAATTLPEVVKYMKEVMEKKTRAPTEYLVHRLPREKPLSEPTATEFVDSGVEVSETEDDDLKNYYGI